VPAGQGSLLIGIRHPLTSLEQRYSSYGPLAGALANMSRRTNRRQACRSSLLVLNRRSFLEGEQWASNRDGKPRRSSRPPHAPDPPLQCASRQRSPALLTPRQRDPTSHNPSRCAQKA